MYKPTGERRCHLCADGHRAGRLADDGDAVRVAAEGRYVVVDPLYCRCLVHEAVVARAVIRGLCRQLRMCEEAEHALAVARRHRHYSVACHRLTGIACLRATAGIQSAAVEVDQHGQLLVHALRRCPDVQIQAVLTLLLAAQAHVAERVALHGVVAELLGGAHAAPVLHRLRSLPPQVTHRRLCERHAAKHFQPRLHGTLKDAVCRLHLRSLLRKGHGSDGQGKH